MTQRPHARQRIDQEVIVVVAGIDTVNRRDPASLAEGGIVPKRVQAVKMPDARLVDKRIEGERPISVRDALGGPHRRVVIYADRRISLLRWSISCGVEEGRVVS
jgi:hypothetical protein